MPISDRQIEVGAASPRDNYYAVVLLVDDQFIVGQMMNEMLGSVPDIRLHFCQDPLSAMALAERLAPTVILQDLKMPLLDGLSLLKQFRANPRTSEIPIVMLSQKSEPLIKAQALSLGASDYLVKLPSRAELIARLRLHSRSYTTQLAMNEAYRNVVNREQQMASEITQAAGYVQSQLPAPITDGPIRVDWRFMPSSQLGGDMFGYQWLDDQHFCLYLLDVSGHDVGASLLAVSIHNALHNRTLPHVNFCDPAAVMSALNEVFKLDKHAGHFFTIWYGVFSLSEHILTFSGGGHPPAMLFSSPARSSTRFQELATSGPPIGVLNHIPFDNSSIHVSAGARLLLYSDGVVEIGNTGVMSLDHQVFTKFVTEISSAPNLMDRILNRCRQPRRNSPASDDCSLILATFT